MAMASSNDHGGSVTMVDGDHHQSAQLNVKRKWWVKFLDVDEAKRQVLFSMPMVGTVGAYYGMQLISVFIAGHLGELQLAASTLAQSWATVTGQSLMVGLSGAVETLCGQGYGAKQYRMLGIYLQANCMISFFFAVIISVFWFFSDYVLIALHQDRRIAKETGVYLRHLIPVIFEFSILYNLISFLQTQSVVIPLVLCSVIPLLAHIGIAYTLVHYTSLGFRGAPVAASISVFVSVAMLSTYVLCSKRFKQTWDGFSSESFRHIFSNLKLALPSAGMVCLEYWAFELLVILAGLMPNPEITTSLVAMCVSTEGIAYMIAYGLSAAASTRVSNELGAGNSARAKHATSVTLKLAILLALVFDLALGVGHKIWAGFFSNSSVIIKKFASLTPFLLASIALDYLQGVLSGVARGGGWQRSVVFINLASYYLVGMLLSCLLGFKAKLYAKGLWIGLICGLACQAIGLLILTLRTKWDRIQLSAERNDDNGDLVQVEAQIPSSSNNS